MKSFDSAVKHPRLQSLDLFRGLTVAAMILVNSPGDWGHIYPILEHSQWNGCTPTDLVFPSFLFMVGISIVFSLESKKSELTEHAAILIRAFRRMIILIALGLGIQLFYHFDFVHLRLPGVLQRIGIVYFISTVMYLKCSSKFLDLFFVLALGIYYLLMTHVSLPDGTPPNLQPGTNLAAWIDRFVFSVDHLNKTAKTWDPLGLLSTLPAVGSTIIGIKVGERLRKSTLNDKTPVAYLLGGGVLLIIAGLTVNVFFPINKPLWSSSYVLYAGGWCTVVFTLVYWYADVSQRGKWLWPFLVFGTNAISAYVLSEIVPGLIDVKIIYREVFVHFLSPVNASLASAMVFVILIWLIMLVLYKRKILIKL
jgi:predicted acyltransferase